MYPQHEKIIIVASGPSAKNFIPPDDIPVIAVNGVIDWIEKANYWFTLDPSVENMRRMRLRRYDVLYFCACPNIINLPHHVRHLWRLTGDGFLSSKEGLTDDVTSVNTGNSAYGALGLAKHMGAKKVLLIGVDGTKEERCEGGFSRDLHHLPKLFESALPYIDFATVYPLNENIKNFTIEEGLKWLRS